MSRVAIPTQNYISCFSGIGGLDLAVRIATPAAKCVCYVEAEVPAAANLATRIEEGSLDDAPIWSNVRTFDGRAWRGIVDGVVAGFPCPDYSVAGKRKGIVGKHGQLWNSLYRVIDDVRPDWCLLENVPGIVVPHRLKRWRWDRERRKWTAYVLPAGLWFVLGDLAALGFDAEWVCVSAAQTGAPHKRERIFILAYRSRRGLRILRESFGCSGLVGGGSAGIWSTPDANTSTYSNGHNGFQNIREQAANWKTPHGMVTIDKDGKRSGPSGGEFGKQCMKWNADE